MDNAITREDRFAGCLLGLAVGDALGTTLELTHQPVPIDDMVGGGPFHLLPGQWTDDTSMALCLAASLVEQGRFEAGDQMRRYLRWRDDGYMSVTGRCFGIGSTVGQALAKFARTNDPIAGSTAKHAAGNGSLMRLAPVPMAFADDPYAAIHWAGESSKTTHGAREAVDSCRYYAGLLVGALAGVDRETLLKSAWSPVAHLHEREPLAPKVLAIAQGSFKGKTRDQIASGGYVIESLEAALWALNLATDFRDGCLAVVNLGHDADTCGAIYGMLAGACFGRSGIPASWLAKLAWRDVLADYAARLEHRSRSARPTP